MASGMANTTTGINVSTADNQYFYEDEVFRIDKKGRIKFGLVLENCGSFSSDEEDYFDDVLSKGEIRVAWHPKGKEEVLHERAVGLADRTLMPGDVVRRLIPGKDTQRGYCREINMRADVKVIGTKYVVKNVNAERLKPLLKMPRDNAVCLDSWVGSTKIVREKVVLKSSCGAVFEVSDLDLCQLKDANIKHRNGLFADTVFYPGQTVTGRIESLGSYKLLTPTMTLKTNKKGKPVSRKFVVQSVQIEGVSVRWQCKALSEDGTLQQPSGFITGEDLKRLKRLNLFESCMLQINDKSYLKISDFDVIVRKSQWEKEQAVKYKLLWSQQQKEQKDDKQQIIQKNTKGSSKIEKIKIKLSTTSNQESNEKKNIKSSGKCNAMKLEVNNLNKEKNKTEKMEANGSNIKKQQQQQKQEQQNSDNTDDWQTEEDDDEEDENEDNSLTESTTLSTCSSPTPRSSPKRSPLLHKKQAKRFKKNTTSKKSDKMPEVGEEVVTEALVVYSTATVVWQDGTVETDIPSTQLYPIHHLDDHEFFPGDFVLSGVEGADVSFRDYGVIQTVDHQGRTAHVKWFTTYTCSDEQSRPTYTGESEVSVYDLKDHPDFQYRPGTIVIRVANFIGEDATCTAGQIIDNYTDGRVKVWWVDGHISMCWPQDLFEVGQHDPDNTFFGNIDSDDNDSWETESVDSEPGCGLQLKCIPVPHISNNLERARVAVSRLEEIFMINPSLQNHEVMRKLLSVYKTCRYLDRLMNTSFFHEDHFMGLLERVRKGGSQSKAERAQDQKNRLFNQSSSPNSKSSNNTIDNSLIESSPLTKEYTSNVILNVSSTPYKTPIENKSSDIISNEKQQEQVTATTAAITNLADNINPSIQKSEINSDKENTHVYSNSKCSLSRYENKLLSYVMSNIEQADLEKLSSVNNEQEIEITKTTTITTTKTTTTTAAAAATKTKSESDSLHDDSGNFSRNEYCDGSSTSYASLNNDNDNNLLTNNSSENREEESEFLLKPPNNDLKSLSSNSRNSIELTDDRPEYVCARLCALLRIQLVKALYEIQQKYCSDNLNLSEVIEYDDDGDIHNLTLPDGTSIAIATCDDIETTVTDVATGVTATDVASITSVPDTPILDSGIIPSTATTTTAIQAVPSECFQVLESAPSSHKFHLTIFHPTNSQQYYKAIRHEHKLLRTSLPPGVWVRVFEDRIDLLSVMIEGPKNTPYEDGMFLFDIQLGHEYPKMPPLCHYISYCGDRLNPNLYEDGKVCVSLLGTWSGKDTEVWNANSTLLQVIVSIQGLILVAEPYFNEAGYEKQKGTQQGKENSRMYNEMVIIKLIQSMTKLLSSPPEIFREQIIHHFKERGKSMYNRIKGWMEMSQVSPSPEDNIDAKSVNKNESITPPEFPLVPASRGFCLTLSGLLDSFYSKIQAIQNE